MGKTGWMEYLREKGEPKYNGNIARECACELENYGFDVTVSREVTKDGDVIDIMEAEKVFPCSPTGYVYSLREVLEKKDTEPEKIYEIYIKVTTEWKNGRIIKEKIEEYAFTPNGIKYPIEDYTFVQGEKPTSAHWDRLGKLIIDKGNFEIKVNRKPYEITDLRGFVEEFIKEVYNQPLPAEDRER